MTVGTSCQGRQSGGIHERGEIVVAHRWSGWLQIVNDAIGGESGVDIGECGQGPRCRVGKACKKLEAEGHNDEPTPLSGVYHAKV